MKVLLRLFPVLLLLSATATAWAVVNQGHRGTGTNATGNDFPENTIPSFLQALTEGADMVELDTTLSADDAVVVIHDGTLDRTTDCTGAVYDLNLADIQACDAAVGTPLEGTGVTIPTLAEVFTALDAMKYEGEVNIEIKSDLEGVVGADHLAERVTAEVLSATWEDRVIFSSFSSGILDAVENLDDAWITGYLTSEVNVNAQADLAAAHGFDGLHSYYLQTLAVNVNYIHSLGLFVNVWTVDPAAVMSSMIERGVDGIITNEPDRLAALLTDDDDDDNDDNDTSPNSDDDSSPTDDDDDQTPSDDDTTDDDDVSPDDDDASPDGDDDTSGDEDTSEGDDDDSCGC